LGFGAAVQVGPVSFGDFRSVELVMYVSCGENRLFAFDLGQFQLFVQAADVERQTQDLGQPGNGFFVQAERVV
jgi:hypothetical protein